MADPEPSEEKMQRITSYPKVPSSLLAEEPEISKEATIIPSDEELAKIPGIKRIYGRNILATFGSGMVEPFFTSLAVDMGITGGQMGWLRAISNLLGNFAQPIFGFLSDKVQRRTIFIALSSILYSSTWVLLLFINSIIMMIVIGGALSLIVSLGTPSWTALLGEAIPTKIRGKIVASVNWFSQLSYIFATIAAGLLLNYISGKINIGSLVFPVNIFIPIIISLFVGLSAATLILTFNEKIARERAKKLSEKFEEQADSAIREKKSCKTPDVREKREEGRTLAGESTSVEPRSIQIGKTIIQNLKDMALNRTFMKFTTIFAFQSFFMSLCWPLFPIRQRSDLSANFFEIALLSVLMSLSTLLTIRYSGLVSDLIGRRTQMFLNRFLLALYPLTYLFATQLWHLFFSHIFVGLLLGLTSAVIQTYLIDVTPEKQRSMYVGFFNMIYGIILFLGSLVGGYLLDFFMGDFPIFTLNPRYSQAMAVSIVFGIGAVGRFLSSLPFLTLKDVRHFPYKRSDLLKLAFKSPRFQKFIFSIVTYLTIAIWFFGVMNYLP